MTEDTISKNDQRKKETRQKLKKAARKVFAQKGYHLTLISDVVNEAGVGQGTFYRHFKDKRHIFSEIKDDLFKSLAMEFASMTEQLPTNFEEYRMASINAILKLVSKLNSHKEIALCLIKESSSIDKEFYHEMQMGFDQFSALAKLYLDHAIAHGFARKCDSLIVSKAIISMAIQIVSSWLSGELAQTNVQKAVEEIVDFGFLGLKVQG